MQLKRTLPLALASSVTAQSTTSLTDALNAQNASLSTINGLLLSSGLGQQLSSLSNVTILAPNNDAFSALLNQSGAAATLADNAALMSLLNYHVLNGTQYADSIGNTSVFIPTYLTNGTYANITGGQRVEARMSDNNVTFFSALKQNATVVTANVNFTGGVIHIIDGVLSIPENITDTLSNANLTAAAGAIKATNLGVSSMRDVTIFAPNNDAFNAIGNVLSELSTGDLASTLGYHVIENDVAYSSDLHNSTLTTMNGKDVTISVINGTVFVNSAKVTIPDLLVSNGVVHVIDQVLNPDNTTATPDPTASSATPGYTGASTDTAGVPFTSGVPTPTTTFPAATSGGSEATSTSNPGAPMKTAAVGAAALFGGAAMLANF
ncbi:putative FAS1 domain-containing protein [Seiridium cardinale]|uniref:FAS1 domain-containing protein n=1 Tax=Seiridium cardinale TaxID=138064 RepID=A0ABR2Y316_9PEZI